MKEWIKAVKNTFNVLDSKNKLDLNFDMINGIKTNKHIKIELSGKNAVCFSWKNDDKENICAVIELNPFSRNDLTDKMEEIFDKFLKSSSAEIFAMRDVVIDDMYGLEISGLNLLDDNNDLFYGMLLTDEVSSYAFIGFSNDDIEVAFSDITGVTRSFYRLPQPALIDNGKTNDKTITALREFAKYIKVEKDIEWYAVNLTFKVSDDGIVSDNPVATVFQHKGIKEVSLKDIYNSKKDFVPYIDNFFAETSPNEMSAFSIVCFTDGRYGLTFHPIEEISEEDSNLLDELNEHNHDHDHHHHHDDEDEESIEATEEDYKNVLSNIASLSIQEINNKIKYDSGMMLINFNNDYMVAYPYYSTGNEPYIEYDIPDSVDSIIEDSLSQLAMYMGKHEDTIGSIMFKFSKDNSGNILKDSINFEIFTFTTFISVAEGSDSHLSSHLINIYDKFSESFNNNIVDYIYLKASLKNNKSIFIEEPVVNNTESLLDSSIYEKYIEDIHAELKNIFMKDDSNYIEIYMFPNGKIGVISGINDLYCRTEEELEEYINDTGLIDYKKEIYSLKRDEILADIYTIKYPELVEKGLSRAGGMPDISREYSDFSWPLASDNEPLHFVAQINLSEIKDFNNYGLNKGMLYLFYDRESGENKVLYTEKSDNFIRYNNENIDEKYMSVRLVFNKSISLPQDVEQTPLNTASDDEKECYEDLAGCVGKIKMFGYADYLEEDMERSMAEKGEEMVLLAQISSIVGSDMEWGNDGCIYFWINKKDLEAKDFTKVLSVMQSYSY